jgi:hypothetical protein
MLIITFGPQERAEMFGLMTVAQDGLNLGSILQNSIHAENFSDNFTFSKIGPISSQK